MLEKFLKGTYSFERQLGKNIVFSKDEIAIIHKRKAFWEKLVHIENLINLPYFSQINQSELNMLLGEKGFEAKEDMPASSVPSFLHLQSQHLQQ